MSPFNINEFLCEMQTVLGCAPSADKVVLATACSGLLSLHSYCRFVYPSTEVKCDRCVPCRLGVPAMVLRSIMGDATKVVELTASEISQTSAHALLLNCPQNHQPMQLLRNVMEVASSGKSFCYIANEATRMNDMFGSAGTDIFIAGYPCNDNSALNTTRFHPEKDATSTAFAAVLPAVLRVLDRLGPKAFALENVTGLLKKRSGPSSSSAEPVMSWVEDNLKSRLGDKYTWFSVMLPSDPLCPVVKLRSRMPYCHFLVF